MLISSRCLQEDCLYHRAASPLHRAGQEPGRGEVEPSVKFSIPGEKAWVSIGSKVTLFGIKRNPCMLSC